MSLLKGTLNVFRFLALGPWPGAEEAHRKLSADTFRPFDGESAEVERMGWTDWRCPLWAPDLDWLDADGHATFGLRVDKRRVPGAILQAHVESRVQALMAEKSTGFVGKDQRISIADEVEAELLKQVLPSMKVTTCMWSYKQGILLADSAPEGLVSQLVQTFGLEARLMSGLEAAALAAPAVPIALLPPKELLPSLYMLWLWKRGLEDGGMSGVDGDQSACFVEDRVSLASESGDVKAITLSKGNPAESLPAFEALARGMSPVSLRIRVLSGDMEWTATLGADLILRSVKLPPSQAKDPMGRLADRRFLIDELLAHMDRRLGQFVQAYAADGADLQADLQAWIQRHGEDSWTGEEDAPE